MEGSQRGEVRIEIARSATHRLLTGRRLCCSRLACAQHAIRFDPHGSYSRHCRCEKFQEASGAKKIGDLATADLTIRCFVHRAKRVAKVIRGGQTD